MPPQSRTTSRGRRDPSLLDQQQEALAQDDIVDAAPVEDEDQIDQEMTILFEGDTVRAGVSIPVTLGEMDRYSLVQSEVTAQVREGETGFDTAARARLAMRVNFFSNLDELEEDLETYAAQKAAEQEQIDRALATRRTGN